MKQNFILRKYLVLNLILSFIEIGQNSSSEETSDLTDDVSIMSSVYLFYVTGALEGVSLNNLRFNNLIFHIMKRYMVGNGKIETFVICSKVLRLA
jgi:hypothetical protein